MPAARHRYFDDLLHECMAGGLNVAVGGESGAPPVVLVHGLSATWRNWNPLIEPLLRDHRVVAVDLPGFGNSPAPEGGGYDLDEVADAIAGALDELGIGCHALVGHSLGGGVSVAYASTRATRVTALGLIAPGGFLRYPGYVRLAWRSELLHRAGRHGTRLTTPVLWVSGRARRIAMSRIVHDLTTIPTRELVRMVSGSTQARSTGAAGAAIVSTSLFDRLPLLTMPTTLLWGDHDRVVPPFRAEEIAALLPQLRELVLLPETGHLPMWERTDDVVAALRALLGGAATDSVLDAAG